MEIPLEPIMELCGRYKNGIRGHVKRSVVNIINKYLEVEKLFQVGHYDKIVSKMLLENKVKTTCFPGIKKT